MFNLSGIEYSPEIILFTISSSVFPPKGSYPTTRANKIHPKLKISMAGSALIFSPVSTSGAIYLKLPAMDFSD